MQLLDKGTYWVGSERLKQFAKSFTLLPKKANIVGLQVADLVAYPITRHILDPNEPNMAYDIIRNNIYTENLKQIGIKIIPHEQKRTARTDNPSNRGHPSPYSIIGMFAAKVQQKNELTKYFGKKV